jgi:hypothetical protein
MKIWFDTEFIEDGKTIDLISIGMVREDGNTFYAENSECDRDRASQWVKDNVLAHLQDGSALWNRRDMAEYIVAFASEKPEFWAYYADYDWVALCQLFGTMMDLPKGWPMYCRDVKQLCDSFGNPTLAKQNSQEHNALADAVWTKQAWEFLTALPPPQVDSGREEIALALEPFAKIGLDVLKNHPGWAHDTFHGEWSGYRLTYADFERAAAVALALRPERSGGRGA